MRSKKNIKAALVALVMVSCIMVFQAICVGAEQKTPVEVKHSGSDRVGERLVYALKEEIRRSSILRLTDLNEPRMIISLQTLDPLVNLGHPNSMAVYSIVWLATNPQGGYVFLNSTIGTCGEDRINSVAGGLVADTDKILSAIAKTFQGGQKR